jgi:hypothetical protein
VAHCNVYWQSAEMAVQQTLAGGEVDFTDSVRNSRGDDVGRVVCRSVRNKSVIVAPATRRHERLSFTSTFDLR